MSKARADALKVLQLTVHFSPNVGGVETHLWDLVKLLSNKRLEVFVLCYRPLSTNTSWKIYEKYNNLEIFRLTWFSGLWFKLIPYPILEFLYLFPLLFIFTPIILIIKNPTLIHAHGLVAATVAVFWGKIFKKNVIISTHNIYSFPKQGLYRNFAKAVFNGAKRNLCLSKKSLAELNALGVKNASSFTYWIDLNNFTKKINTRKKFNWREKFIVLFVGRLILEKGIDILLDSVKSWDKDIGLVFVGIGPMESVIINETSKNPRIHFLGKMDQKSLPNIYSAADVLIVPSTSEEGFGRVIMESLACSTPVVASNKGAIPEVMDESVGRLIDINSASIKNSIEDLFRHPLKLAVLSGNARKFAERRYSEENADTIIQAYTN